MDINDLKRRKKNLKLTTAQLAYLAELPVGTVSKVMTGETKKPSYITIEKIDKALAHEEMIARLDEYKRYLEEYLKQHPDEDVDMKELEQKYRKERGLNNDPIPFAVPKGETENHGNLAIVADKRATVSMLGEIGEDRNVELLDGNIIINEMPGIKHQTIVQNIGWAIQKFIDDNKGKCKVFSIGVNVRISEDDYSLLIPDIVVTCDPDSIRDDGIWGAPDWVIEVVSRSTRHRDYRDKMHKYMSCGVREYWIVDPDKEKVTTYIEGEPMMAYNYNFDDEIPVYIYDGRLKIKVRVYE